MARGIFITGTDTGVGKTVVAVGLLRALAASGQRAAGMKPVSAGIEEGGSVNADVAAMARAGNVDAPLADRNPFALVPAIAPHLAAVEAGIRIDLDVIAAAYDRIAARSDVVVVEGAGGVRVPIDARHDMLDIALKLRLPVLLVVGVRLGCLNHALLSAAAISARGLELSGWVANCIDPDMRAAEANIADLERRLSAPLVAQVAFGAPPFLSDNVLEKLGLDGSPPVPC
jgi:dethiobiotin synthetase